MGEREGVARDEMNHLAAFCCPSGRPKCRAYCFGRYFGTIHQAHGVTDGSLEHVSQQRIVRATEDQGVNWRAVAEILANQQFRLRPLGEALLHYVDQHGAGLRPRPQPSLFQAALIRPAANGALSPDHTHLPGSCRSGSGLYAGIDHAPNGNRTALRQRRQSHGGCRVAGHYQAFDAQAAKEIRYACRKLHHHFRRLAPVGNASGVPEIHKIPVWQAPAQRLKYCESADSRIENGERRMQGRNGDHLFLWLHGLCSSSDNRSHKAHFFMKARVFVSFKSTVLDPQGQTICNALHGLGYPAVADVRQGKFFDISVTGDVPDEQARKDVELIAHEVLANPVIEEYRIEILE
jgi:phosphoribosylformylglycinamidine synthase subunit PurS